MPTSKQIKAVRKRLGETQTAFAARFGVDQATIHRWEKYGIPAYGTARLAVDRLLKEIELEVRAA